jgi:hypothetical protein
MARTQAGVATAVKLWGIAAILRVMPEKQAGVQIVVQ